MDVAVDWAARDAQSIALSFAVALAVGLLIGLERERHHPTNAGIRTFGLAALSGCLALSLSPWVLIAVVIGVGVLVVVGYLNAAERDPGVTTEVALLAAPLLGALAWLNPALASAVAVVVTVVLASKERLHRFARETLSEQEIDDALVFFVAAVVILPLLPSGPWGPFGALDLQRIWWIVVALAAVGWAGYIATRVLGARKGLLVTGLAGGFVSASATIGAMSRRAREPGLRRPALGAAVLANAATLVQLELVTAVVSPSMALALLPAMVAGTVVILALTALLVLRAPPVDTHDLPKSRPLQWRPILAVTTVLVLATVFGAWASQELGASGAIAVAAVSGLADAHAGGLATANLHSAGKLALDVAVVAAGVALATNLGTKILLSITAGGWRIGAQFTALVAIPTAVVALTLFLTV